ncbi:probable ascorbate-specific transmembrane electron transporter 2 [Coffea arabica]|uniref:ascorbate ferrireductase (transmembrane) n=1 Tax=Coffea arabica TaxID=13443 RepID=A0A6P6V7Q0_COFAR|nr:probable ascorbate-specific transmembrane electron transporter 2 [Coffea arabica]
MALKSSSYQTSATPISLFAHLVFIAIFVLVLVWLLKFREGLSFTSDNKPKLFNLHPLFMVIGFVLISGQAIMTYKTFPATRKRQKLIHMTLNFIALLAAIVGLYAVFQYHHDLGIPHVYTLHSWFGISTASLFFLQWLFGFFTFWVRARDSTTRGNLAPWHVLLGMVIFSMAILSAVTGLIEKFTFMSLRRGQEALIVNFTGLLIFLFGVSVGCTVLLPRSY